jgi:hypothetical protein
MKPAPANLPGLRILLKHCSVSQRRHLLCRHGLRVGERARQQGCPKQHKQPNGRAAAKGPNSNKNDHERQGLKVTVWAAIQGVKRTGFNLSLRYKSFE